jgi:quercetin dioxygenase-like cupin family protein
VKRWHLPSLAPSSDKRRAREPGAGAPRLPTVGRSKPRVLFSHPECRAVVVDLWQGEELGDHRVRERTVLEVIAGQVSIECSGETVECEAGSLVTFDPGEHHSVRALADARLLLVLAPWPAEGHAGELETPADAQRLPANATVDPIQSHDSPVGGRA